MAQPGGACSEKSPAAVGKEPEQVSSQAVFACVFVALTGFFHGYDNGVVSDVFTMPSFRDMMGWPEQDDTNAAFQKGLTVNGFNVGAAISAVLCGHLLVDRYGRRPALIVGSVLFALGGLVQTASTSAGLLIAGRLVAGVGVGVTSCAGPAYISEVAPAKVRGALVGVYQSNVCLAIVFAAVLNHFDQEAENGWRWSLGVQVFLGGITAFGLIFMSDTPRFLQSAGQHEKALKVLTRLRAGNEQEARRELELVQAELEAEKEAGSASWSEVFSNPFFRNVVLIGCLTQFFQIITGINAMVSYGGTLFTTVGVHGIVSSLIPNLAFLLGNTIGSFCLVDWVGRRTLLVWGMLGMSVTLLAGGIIGLTAETTVDGGEEHVSAAAGYAIIAMVVGYMFSFGISWGFGAWLYISEVMPLRVRGKAVGLCTGVNWGPANILSAFLTPVLIASPAGPGGTLLFFGGISLLVVPFAMTCLPETAAAALKTSLLSSASRAARASAISCEGTCEGAWALGSCRHWRQARGTLTEPDGSRRVGEGAVVL
eukprot:CAMPEP_0179116434 /NCGR_PEP_ID=MMETSP0796-20121207/54615_1 /TAXON_ID=73915 /ORGANISM="Pyrodinium bahamense, Strain pbaha01" /LENGTH=538 /DNA_ID=CAMNT_0020814719 /DNA_START=68 /DNA_END=1682 /DNA_ORIENTATION=+